jgi:hypothetical protein
MKSIQYKRFLLLALLPLVLFACASQPIESESQAKMRAIDRYFTIVPTRTLLDDLALKISRTLPEENRSEFIDLMTNKFDIKVMEDSMRAAMLKHFTLLEIEAMVDFYSQPEGRSVMKKMGDYMADVMPDIQSEVERAINLQAGE